MLMWSEHKKHIVFHTWDDKVATNFFHSASHFGIAAYVFVDAESYKFFDSMETVMACGWQSTFWSFHFTGIMIARLNAKKPYLRPCSACRARDESFSLTKWLRVRILYVIKDTLMMKYRYLKKPNGIC